MAVLPGCGAGDTDAASEPDPASADTAPADPAEGIQVQVGIDRVAYEPGATVRIRISARNTGDAPRTLPFSDGQRVDAELRSEDGPILLRWSDDQMFTQALGEETLPADDEGLVWELELPAPAETGRYTLVGRVTATGMTLEARVPLQVTADGTPDLSSP
jgi:hypothetical protein